MCLEEKNEGRLKVKHEKRKKETEGKPKNGKEMNNCILG